MERSKSEIAKDVARSLEEDLLRFAADLERTTPSASVRGIQSSLLTDADLPQPISALGEKLMREILAPSVSDIAVKVDGEVFLCHKEVLRQRSDYFRVMLQAHWTEDSAEEITLNDIGPAAIAALLCFLYGGSIEMPKFCSIFDIAQVADMYGVYDLLEAVKFHIATKMCHSFHKPCKACKEEFSDVLRLAALFGNGDLLDKVLKWNAKYFLSLWRTKGYYALPENLHKKCLKAVIEFIDVSNAVQVMIKVDKLLSSITRVRWTMPVVANASELLDYCCDFIAGNVWVIVDNYSIAILVEGTGWKHDLLERLVTAIRENLCVENAAEVYTSANRMVEIAVDGGCTEEIRETLSVLKKKAWLFLVSNCFAVIHTESWQRLSEDDKRAASSQALCGGDEKRRPSKKPVLSSSLNIKPLRPRVLVTSPMKVKARKTTTHRNTSKSGTVTVEQNPCEEVPDRKPIVSEAEFVSGTYIEELVTIAYYGQPGAVQL